MELPFPRHAGRLRYDASEMVKLGRGMSFSGDC